MKYWKNIAFVVLAFLAIIGIGNALGFMLTNGASAVAVIGLIIAAIPAALVIVRAFKQDVAAPNDGEKK